MDDLPPHLCHRINDYALLESSLRSIAGVRITISWDGILHYAYIVLLLLIPSSDDFIFNLARAMMIIWWDPSHVIVGHSNWQRNLAETRQYQEMIFMPANSRNVHTLSEYSQTLLLSSLELDYWDFFKFNGWANYRKSRNLETNFPLVFHLHLLVRVLYRIRKPHWRQRTGSPPLITFFDPQSPHRYSTPRKMGNPAGGADEGTDPAAAPGVDIVVK